MSLAEGQLLGVGESLIQSSFQENPRPAEGGWQGEGSPGSLPHLCSRAPYCLSFHSQKAACLGKCHHP
jgi:hypothetical protein